MNIDNPKDDVITEGNVIDETELVEEESTDIAVKLFLSTKQNDEFTFPLLPPHIRKRHMLLAGIYYDFEKPILNTIVGSSITELKDLYINGIKWKNSQNIEVVGKFILLTCSVDSVARYALLRMTQFNGECGCTFCYASGTQYSGNLLVRYYSSLENAHDRTDKEIRADMREAFVTKKKKFVGLLKYLA